MAADPLLADLLARRAYACRLSADRALLSLDEAATFLAERGMLTLMADSALPSLFGACHEEQYQPGGHGFATWPKTKWRWGGELRERADVICLRLHRGKVLYVAPTLISGIAPLCGTALAAAEHGEYGPAAARLVAHLAATGPTLLDDLKDQLSLSASALRALRNKLEPVGTLISRDVVLATHNGGERQTSELARWDQVFTVPAECAQHERRGEPEAAVSSGEQALAALAVAGVRAAVLAPEAEVRCWFSWPIPGVLLDRLVAQGHLRRPAAGWLALG